MHRDGWAYQALALLHERTQVYTNLHAMRARHNCEGHSKLYPTLLMCSQIIAAAANVAVGLHELLGKLAS